MSTCARDNDDINFEKKSIPLSCIKWYKMGKENVQAKHGQLLILFPPFSTSGNSSLLPL